MTDYTEADAAATRIQNRNLDVYDRARAGSVLAAAYTALRADLARVTAERDAARQEAAAVATDDVWLVWSNEHRAWWGPNRSGYTSIVERAGRYTLGDALDICDVRSQEPGKNPTELVQPAPEWLAAARRLADAAKGES